MNLEKIKKLYLNIDEYDNKELTINGWIRSIRVSKNFGFIDLNDGSCFKNVQIVFEENNVINFNEISKQSVGAAIVVSGRLVKTPQAKQDFEIKAESILIEGTSTSDYPLQKKKHSFEYLRTIAYLRPRTNTFSAVFRVRSLISYAIHKFFQDRGFVYVNTPIITGSDCEGAGEMFNVTSFNLQSIPFDDENKIDFSKDFFGKETKLTVSGQLSAETFAMAFGDVYTFGPTFRAENSNTQRHAAEFWMVEPEMAFADINDNMKVAEELLKYIIKYVLENAFDEISFFNKFIDTSLLNRLNNILESDFGHVTYSQAVEILEKSEKEFEYPVKWGIDLQTEHERFLTEEVYKKPVFVTDYPKDIKAFYMRMNDDKKTVAAMDLLVPGIGEIIGGSQREERLDFLKKRMEELGLKEEDYWWYINLRKFGGTKHSGFGLGFERAVMYLTGMSNIRDVIPFPRTVNNAQF